MNESNFEHISNENKEKLSFMNEIKNLSPLLKNFFIIFIIVILVLLIFFIIFIVKYGWKIIFFSKIEMEKLSKIINTNDEVEKILKDTPSIPIKPNTVKEFLKIVATNDEVEKIVKIGIIYKFLYKNGLDKNGLDKNVDFSNQDEFASNLYHFYCLILMSKIPCSCYDQLNLNHFSIIESLYQSFNLTDNQKSTLDNNEKIILKHDDEEFIIKKNNNSNYIIESKSNNCPNYEIEINNNSLFKIKVIFKEKDNSNSKYSAEFIKEKLFEWKLSTIIRIN